MKKRIAFIALAVVLSAGAVSIVKANVDEEIDGCDAGAGQRYALQVVNCADNGINDGGGYLYATCHYPQYNGPCCLQTTRCPN